MSKVLFISAWAPPAVRPQAILTQRLVNELSYQGHDITLLTYHPVKEINKHVNIVTINKPVKIRKLLLGKLCNTNSIKYQKYVHARLLTKAINLLGTGLYEVFITFSNPYYLNLLGTIIKEKFPAIKWVAHYSDPYLYNPYHQDKNNQHNDNIKFNNEKYVLGKADYLVFTNRQQMEYIMSFHKAVNVKKTVIPHCYSRYELPEKGNIRHEIAPVFLHVGAIYGERKADNLLIAIRNIIQRTGLNIKMVFLGADLYGSNDLNNLQDLVLKTELKDHVELIPTVAHDAIDDYILRSNVLVSIDAEQGPSIFLPSKIVEYLAYRKPIIALTQPGSPVHEFCIESGCSFANINDVNSIEESLLMVAENLQDSTPDDGVTKKYEVSEVAGLWSQLIQE